MNYKLKVQFSVKIYIIVIFLVTLLCSCNTADFEVKDFTPIINHKNKINDSILSISADLSNSVLYGIEIPSVKQLPNGKFIFQFSIKKPVVMLHQTGS